jgi:hypothetical protein
MTRFELSRLDSYDEASLLEELRRVASLVKSPVLTQSEFDRHSKASASVICRRFGGWEQALTQAGLAKRFRGTPKARRTLGRTFSDEELLAELRAVALKLGTRTVTIEQFNRHGQMNAATIRRRFGSWGLALERAGLAISNLGKRYSETDYFENLLKVWTHYGRQPTYGEMNRPPSRIGAQTYVAKWSTWRNALKAFLERLSADVTDSSGSNKPGSIQPISREARKGSEPSANSSSVGYARQHIPLGVRYDVLLRDKYRCVICGASPASKIGCELHVDHITPVALHGATIVANLRTLCSECNIGKSAKDESSDTKQRHQPGPPKAHSAVGGRLWRSLGILAKEPS